MVGFKYRKTRLDFARTNLNEAALVLLWTEETKINHIIKHVGGSVTVLVCVAASRTGSLVFTIIM